MKPPSAVQLHISIEVMPEKEFARLLRKDLGKFYNRALRVFRRCGKALSTEVTNMLLHAVDKGKVKEVLGELERHYGAYLRHQDPEIRGLAEDSLPEIVFDEQTEVVREKIYIKILGLKRR